MDTRLIKQLKIKKIPAYAKASAGRPAFAKASHFALRASGDRSAGRPAFADLPTGRQGLRRAGLRLVIEKVEMSREVTSRNPELVEG